MPRPRRHPDDRGLVAPANATGATTVSADHVAGVVEAAVGTDRFYLFTNPDTPDRLADQFDDVWRHTGAGSPRPQEAPS
ncbi:hypothetical protein ACFQV2_20445 [Actinokineospora soli]|uniref:Uncharacterized protein n=1 Tax=Actinokineospora soli TaxID=1048753 RepID=A0ABW2TQ80_9PSEU